MKYVHTAVKGSYFKFELNQINTYDGKSVIGYTYVFCLHKSQVNSLIRADNSVQGYNFTEHRFN